MLWFVVLVLVLLIYFTVFKPLRYWKIRGVPYSKPLPLVGNFGRDLIGKTIEHLYNEFPNQRYNGIFQFSQPMLLIRDLDLIKQVTIKDFDHFMDHRAIMSEDTDSVMNKNLFLLKGQKWKEMRATLSPAFTSNKMKSMFVLISKCAQEFTDHFLTRNESVIELDMKDTFTRFSNDAIASAAFGVTCNSLEDKENEFYRMGLDLTTSRGIKFLKVLAIRMFPSILKVFKMNFFPEHVSKFFRTVIKNAVEYRENNHLVRPDMIHLLMEARKGRLKHEEANIKDAEFATVTESEIGKNSSNRKTELTLDDITAQALAFFFAGFETSSSLLCFLSHELAVNPDIQEKLIEEIDETQKKIKGEVLSYEVLLGMKYLDMVVSETLRKWPLGVQLERQCVKKYAIEAKQREERPLVIEEGTSMMIPVYGIHRDSRYYNDPENFDPERFSEVNKHKIVPNSYMPFGIGPRNCIGSRFALLEVKTIIFCLLSKFEFVVIEKTRIPIEKNMSRFKIMPTGSFWLGLKRR